MQGDNNDGLDVSLIILEDTEYISDIVEADQIVGKVIFELLKPLKTCLEN